MLVLPATLYESHRGQSSHRLSEDSAHDHAGLLRGTRVHLAHLAKSVESDEELLYNLDAKGCGTTKGKPYVKSDSASRT